MMVQITIRSLETWICCGLWICTTMAHPQCLDFGPPFEVMPPGLKFCSRYEGFSCCSANKDQQIQMLYEDLVPELESDPGLQGCEVILQDMLCLHCSPYEAHVYDGEAGPQREFPGLCRNYCANLYHNCSRVINTLFPNNTELLEALSTEDEFCSKVAIPDANYCYPDLEADLELLGNISREVRNAEGCLCLQEFARKLLKPLLFITPPDGTNRIFVGEQRGVVYMYDKGDVTTFLDITRRVFTTNNFWDERGFLSMTFHPNFRNNRKFYVMYSASVNGSHINRISQLKARRNQTRKAGLAKEKVILEVEQPYPNHNGGQLLFGLDNYLYIFLGDGGNRGDPHDYAQNRNSLLGKVLRININTNKKISPYRIPPSNPFICKQNRATCVDWRPEIYAYGIRNIWRCDLDEGDPDTGYGRGRIICGDVGQNAWEEIDIIEAGGNYGWNLKEGFACYADVNCTSTTIEREVLPVHVYPHAVGQSVTGGHVYRGCQSPNMMGWYVYADYMNGKLFKLQEDLTTGQWNSSSIDICGPELCFNGLTSKYHTSILSFGEDANGEIYMLATHNLFKQPNGKIYKLVDPRRRGDPGSCLFQPNVDT